MLDYKELIEEINDVKEIFDVSYGADVRKALKFLELVDFENAYDTLDNLYIKTSNKVYENMFKNWMLVISNLEREGYLINEKGEYVDFQYLKGVFDVKAERISLIKVYPGLTGKLYVPEYIEILEDDCFSNTSLEEIVLPENITSIGETCFCKGKNLKRVNIPEGIKEIPSCCFWGCENLEEIWFPKSLERICSYAFFSCSELKEIYLGNNIEVFENYSFNNCKNLERINLTGKNVKKIEEGAFKNCFNLKEFKIIKNEEIIIDEDAFTNCTKCVVDIESKHEVHWSNSFDGCKEVNFRDYEEED